MDERSRWIFLALILAQAVHSVEEYSFRLFDVFAPARALSEALGFDRSVGFVLANIALVAFGLYCWAAWVRPGRRPGRGVAWAWATLEILNAGAHLALAAAAGGYFPGLATAPLLLVTAIWLLLRLARTPRA